MELFGHRGARNEAPENTLAGFRYLRSLNIHKVELDIRLSKDDELIVIHDITLDRTTDKTGAITELNAQQLQQVNAAAKFKAWKDSTPVPLLEDVLTEWNQLEKIQLEVKGSDERTMDIIAAKLPALIKKLNIEDQSVVTSAHLGFLARMQANAPHIDTGFVAERWIRTPVSIAEKHDCQYLCIDWHRCNRKIIHAAKDKGMHVSIWTVNEIPVAEQMYKWGADSLISDLPSTFKPLLEQWNAAKK